MHIRKFKKTRGVVAAGHAKTAGAGCHALRQGGNAIDAAVAAAFMTFVAEPSLTTIAGGGYMMVHQGKTGRSTLFDFFSEMPGRGKKRIRTEELDFRAIHLDFGGTTQEFHIGRGSAAVPGNVHGLLTAHKKCGRLPLDVVLEPAIRLARGGVKITKNGAFVLSVVRGTVMASAGTRALYAPQGTLLREGEIFSNPALADTMEGLVREGRDLFYLGDIAKRIAREIGDHGGLITMDDLAAYRTIARKPLTISYRGTQIVTTPPPSMGGALIACSLQLLGALSFPRTMHASDPRLLAALLEVMRLTNEVRAKFQRITPRVVKRYQHLLLDRLAHPQHPMTSWEEGLHARGSILGNTTHLSVLDEHQNAASVTTSHGEGNGICIRGTGVVLNNLLGEEDINPYGFHQWTPGDRLPSMMAPTLLLRDGRPLLALGSGGSNRLRTAILQTIVKIVDGHATIGQAVRGPRIHWERGLLDFEPGLPQRAVALLKALEPHHAPWKAKNLYFGGVHAVMRVGRNHFDGAGDPRRGGALRTVA